jgi:hypothetical protein
MPIYKYVTPARIDVLRNGRVRFTQAAAMNDPFEAHPCFIELRKSLEDRARRLVKSVESKFDAHSIVAGNLIIPKMVRDDVAKFQSDLAAEYPMLSLTGKRNNLLMWSHYADSHRGFVIGFDSDNPFFHREKPRTMTPLDEVTYSNKRPVMPPFEKSNPENAYEMFLTKSEEWAYEEELRMFAQPRMANGVEKDSRGFAIYLFDMPPEVFVEIIFGLLMSADVKHEIAAIVEERYPHIELHEAKLSETDFDLDIVPYRTRIANSRQLPVRAADDRK